MDEVGCRPQFKTLANRTVTATETRREGRENTQGTKQIEHEMSIQCL